MALYQRDQLKLINAGFILIRADYGRLAIKHKTKGIHDWKTLDAGYTSKVALDRKMKELLKISNIIEV